jgi:hypothetical protein
MATRLLPPPASITYFDAGNELSLPMGWTSQRFDVCSLIDQRTA